MLRPVPNPGRAGRSGAADGGEVIAIHARHRAQSIAINGTLSGQALQDRFSPQLVFSLNELQMHLAAPSVRGGENPDPFLSGENKSLRKSREAPDTIALLELSLDVSAARTLSLIGLALSLLGAGILRAGYPPRLV